MTKVAAVVDTVRLLRAALLGAAVAVAAVMVAPPDAAKAQSTPIIYPSQGQSLEQQAKDEAECRTWAQQQTGFNPSLGPSYSGSIAQPGGGLIAGSARGAALGAIGGAIGGDAGKGAAIGAGVGAAGGLMRRSRQRRAQVHAQQQAMNNYSQQLVTYNRSFGACMQGRGYAVN